MAPLPAGQGGLQVFPPADLDQPPQGPRPAPQPLHVDRLAGGEPEPVPGHLLRRRRAELVPEHQPQVACQLGALPGLAPEEPVAAPAGDAVAEGGRQAGQDRRDCRPVGHAFRAAQQASPAALSPMRGLPPFRAPRPRR